MNYINVNHLVQLYDVWWCYRYVHRLWCVYRQAPFYGMVYSVIQGEEMSCAHFYLTISCSKFVKHWQLLHDYYAFIVCLCLCVWFVWVVYFTFYSRLFFLYNGREPIIIRGNYSPPWPTKVLTWITMQSRWVLSSII